MSHRIRVETARTVAAIEAHVSAWDDLCERALEDNVYLTPEFLVESLARFGAPWEVAFVYEGDRLVGVAPFSYLPPTRRAPLVRLSTYVSFHVYLAYPLVDAERAAEAIRAVWDHLDRPGRDFGLVLIEQIDRESPTWRVVETELRRRGRAVWIKKVFTQATLRRRESYAAYLAELPASRRKGIKRSRRALERHGPVEVICHRNLDRDPDLAQRFVDLETRTWKHARGVSLASSPDDAAFFAAVIRRLAARDRLFVVEIAVGGRPAAMTVNFVCGRTLFAVRTAFDPEFADGSPGVLAEVETARIVHETTGIGLCQGGNDAADSYLNHYWRDLRTMQVVTVATPALRSRAYVRLARLARRLSGHAVSRLDTV